MAGEAIGAALGGAIGGCISGAIINSTCSWVAVPIATCAWAGALGGTCGMFMGYVVISVLEYFDIPESAANTAGIIAGLAISVIVQGGIFMGVGMTAGAAFTAAASTLIVPVALMVVFALVMIGWRCLEMCCRDPRSDEDADVYV